MAGAAARADLGGTLLSLGAAPSIAQQFQSQIASALGGVLGTTLGSLTGSLGQSLLGVGGLLQGVGGDYLDPTPGTANSVGYISWQGLPRRYVAIYPVDAPQGAPVFILLHAHGVSPERMANLARAGRLAADDGAIVLVPEGEGLHWNDDPTSGSPIDDVGFLSHLIDRAVADFGVDATRVYAAGYSNGGFMAERLGCELAVRIAGVGAVAATMRVGLAAHCSPARAMPLVLMLGNADPVIWYDGNQLFESAAQTAALWSGYDGCGSAMQTQRLPNAVKDGTRVVLTQFTACPQNVGLSLYTIDSGGHTWPGSSDGAYTTELGRTTHNLDATVALWQFLIAFNSNPS